MAKTFEALIKAERDSQLRLEQTWIPFSESPRNDRLPPQIDLSASTKPKLAEDYRKMAQKIASLTPSQIRSLLFCSSTEGEGTSTVVVSFALTLAADGSKVLLVDANLRNPFLHNLFSLEQRNGFVDLLLNRSRLCDVTKKSRIKNLSVITSGIPHSTHLVIPQGSSFGEVMTQMKTEYDWVLLDSCSISDSSYASVFAAGTDAVIMVLQAEKTRWEVAQNARKQIESEKARVLGVVLNRRRMYIPSWLYKRLP
jgi:capsular exopolysaccharide synthesis family protein